MRAASIRGALVLGAVLLGGAALADPYDFKLAQLGNPYAGGTNADPLANARFRAVMKQWAAAISGINLAPPETLGHAAFAFSVDLQVVDFGAPPQTSSTPVTFPTTGEFKGPLLIPSVHVRKGLPWSFELGGRVGWIEKSRMGVGTVELKWAVNEGFTFLPDIGVRGHVSKILNTRDFDLTVGGLDLGIGKQFAIGGMVTLTPYIGWNLAFVGASTGNIDFNPSRTLAEADAPQQFRDIYIFDSMGAGLNTHNRFYGGFRFIGGALQVGAEVSGTVLGSFTDTRTGETINLPPVLSYNFSLGLDF